MEGYVDLKRRAELVDQAEMALRRMQRDIRAALPNSIRTFDGGKGIEMLHVVDGGRYRRLPDADGNGEALKFNQADGTFDVLGRLNHFSDIDTGNDQVVIYNLASSGTTANAYHGDNGAKLDSSTTSTTIKLDTTYKFPYTSPYQRFFIVDEAISYKIEGGKLRRYSGYNFDNNPGPDFGGTESLVAKLINDNPDKSYFEYAPGTASRSGLVTMRVTLEDNEERISLLHQVHVDNAP
jgi:MSHA biogenesis protein MshO